MNQKTSLFRIMLFASGLLGNIAASAQGQASAFSPALDTLPLNQIQVIGSHNSYKKPIDTALFKIIQQQKPKAVMALDYEHIPIPEQLDMGLANLEIDVYVDETGGRYAHPKGLEMEKDVKGLPPYDPDQEMMKPGFKILHVKDWDFRSQYLTLKACLADLKKWSDTHPRHLPIFITLEPKDQFTQVDFDKLDQALIEGLGRKKILVPDDVRKNHERLGAAIKEEGWPTVAQSRGKFIFLLDAKGEKEILYVKDHPALRGRVLFANADPGTPEAAMLFRNDSKDQLKEIQELVKQGYIIRTRADANTWEARNNDYSAFEAAKQSGAQIITTDYYKKSTHFPSNYQVEFEGGAFSRKNPLFSF